MTGALPDDVSLGEARDWLRLRAYDDGAHCPCCTQFTKVYRRKINSSMVRALVALYRKRWDFVHLPPVDPSHGEAARLSYWGLIEEEPIFREDGGRAGWWRITPLGADWLRGQVTVPMTAHIYDSRLLKLDGPPWHVTDAVKQKFDLQELMAS
jgi:hypothetical protein